MIPSAFYMLRLQPIPCPLYPTPLRPAFPWFLTIRISILAEGYTKSWRYCILKVHDCL
ncbi:hypothetical protein I7I48_04330 [Histoplasma ohiense]|nr:hypothetical protein I7I48_04330 [Histoplasma ohiense (nom. inval.)]